MNAPLPEEQIVKLEGGNPSCFEQKFSNTPKKAEESDKQYSHDKNSTMPKDYSEIIPEKLKHSRLAASELKRSSKKLWNQSEDTMLRYLVETKGAKQWAVISSYFQGRCGKQCRERWHNHLRNGIKKGGWTNQEEWMLFLGVHAYGKRWSIISKMLKGRTQNTLKNHWNCKMNPKKTKLQNRLRLIIRNSLIDHRNMALIEVNLLEQIIRRNACMWLLDSEQGQQLEIEVLKSSLQAYFKTYTDILIQLNLHADSEKLQPSYQREFEYDANMSFGKSQNRKSHFSPISPCTRKDNQNTVESEEMVVKKQQTLSGSYFCNAFNQSPYKLEYVDQKQEYLGRVEEGLQSQGSFENSEYAESRGEGSMNSEYDEQKMADCQKSVQYQINGFDSPINEPAFNGIYLGSSNQKK